MCLHARKVETPTAFAFLKKMVLLGVMVGPLIPEGSGINPVQKDPGCRVRKSLSEPLENCPSTGLSGPNKERFLIWRLAKSISLL